MNEAEKIGKEKRLKRQARKILTCHVPLDIE